MGQFHNTESNPNSNSDSNLNPIHTADNLITEANNLNKSKSWFISNTDKKERMIKLYRQASTYYKMAGYKVKSAYALQHAINLELDLPRHSNYFIGNDLMDIASDLQDSNTSEAIASLKQAEQLFISDGLVGSKLTNVAKCNELLAQIHLNTKQYSQAVYELESAVRYYKSEKHTDFDILRCCTNIIDVLLIDHLYDDIIEFCELSVTIYKKYTYQDHNINTLLLTAILCKFVVEDIVQTKKMIELYTITYDCFAKSAEHAFASDCINAYEKFDLKTLHNLLDLHLACNKNPRIKKLLGVMYFICNTHEEDLC